MNDNQWLQPVVDTYIKYFGKNPKKIVDVGSRDGDDANWLLQKLGQPFCKVVCIEARSDAADNILNKYPNFSVFNTAVADFIGEADFVQFTNPDFFGSSSMVLERKNAYASESLIIKVPVTRLDKILLPETIDILKIDVEGNSVPVIFGMGNLMKNVLVAHIETETPNRVHWGEEPNNVEVIQIMQDMGFALANVSYQWGWSIQDQVWINIEHERYMSL